MRAFQCALALASLAAGQELSLDGAPAPGLRLGQGLTLVDRAALRGVSIVDVVCPPDGIKQRALIVGDDRDAGVTLLWSACEAPAPGEDVVLIPGMKVATAQHETRVAKVVDSASFGFVFPLQTEKSHPRAGAPLFSSEQQPAGWYAARLVDGQLTSFALPIGRLRVIPRDRWQTPAEWNAAYRAEFEEAYQRAMAYLWLEDFESARFYLEKATRLAPNDARAWFHFAFTEGKQGHSVARSAAYRKALALNPNMAEAHYNLAVVLAMSGKPEEARPNLRALQQLLSPLAERLEGFLEYIHADPLPGPKQ